MEIRKMNQTELDQAIKEELERAGGFYSWREKGLTDELAPEPRKPRTLSKGKRYFDACKLAAECRGIAIEQLFTQEPERYKWYCASCSKNNIWRLMGPSIRALLTVKLTSRK